MRRLLIVLAVLVALAILIAGVGILMSGGTTRIGGAKILTLRLDAPLVDYTETPDFQLFRRRSAQSLAGIYETLLAARQDPGVEGLAVYIQQARFGYGKAHELRLMLQALADVGKFVDCYLETAGEGTNGTLPYYLASACQRITLSPLGEVNIVGIYSDSPFVRGSLDKLKIEPQFGHVGPYKSGAEFYTETEHSEPAREALAAVLDDLYEHIVSAVSQQRDLSSDRVKELIDAAPLTTAEALEAGLIDEIAYPDIFEQALLDRFEGRAVLTSLDDYSATAGSFGAKRVAVVFAQGTIIRGWNGTDPWSQQRYIGADSMREILNQVEEDDGVVGVVLRIDSPGGSALASDLILREVEKLADKKPVVVSMSDVAASGGYYISARAAKIVAAPTTITGSIGVYGGKLVTAQFQKELLGITHDPLKRGANADFYSSTEPFTPDQADKFQSLMEGVYTTFVGHVAAGRNLPAEQVEAVAGGRIWTGGQALERSLVDDNGGFDRAIELVLETAGLAPDTPVDLDFYPRPPSLLDVLSQGLAPFLNGRSASFPLPPWLRSPYALELPAGLLRALQPD